MKLLAYCGLYTTPDGAELTDWIPVRQNASEGWTPALERAVPDVQKGDILTIVAKAQRTNNLHKAPWNLAGGRNVACGYRLALIAPGIATPIQLTNWTGSNVDMMIHHQPSVDPQIWEAPETYGDVVVRLYLKCGNTNAVFTGSKRWLIELDRGYGHLSVLHTRPVEWPPAV